MSNRSLLKRLAGDTMYYGLSTIIPRLIGYALFPIHTAIFLPEEYGEVGKVFSWLAITLALLTFGMETSFFRFASREKSREGQDSILTTALFTLMGIVTLFSLSTLCNLDSVANMVGVTSPRIILWVVIVIACDVITAIPFAQLRLQKRPRKFLAIKVASVLVNFALNILFLIVLPRYADSGSEWVDAIYNRDLGVEYVFMANVASSLVSVMLLVPTFRCRLKLFSFVRFKEMVIYGFPIMVVSVLGMVSLMGDKILLDKLLPEGVNSNHEVGLYNAGTKLAVLMTLFVQGFRYAFEPFFFSHSESSGADKRDIYSLVMNYFVAFGLVIFLVVTTYLDWFQLLSKVVYRDGMQIVPVVMVAYLFMGITSTLSLWYKVTDRTYWGIIITAIGAAVSITINVNLIPQLSYVGASYAILACYITTTVISYRLMRKYYPIDYDLKRLSLLGVLFALAYYIGTLLPSLDQVDGIIYRTLLVGVTLYAGYLLLRDKKVSKADV